MGNGSCMVNLLNKAIRHEGQSIQRRQNQFVIANCHLSFVISEMTNPNDK